MAGFDELAMQKDPQWVYNHLHATAYIVKVEVVDEK